MGKSLMLPRCINFPPILLSKIDEYRNRRTKTRNKLGLSTMNRSQAVRELVRKGLEYDSPRLD